MHFDANQAAFMRSDGRVVQEMNQRSIDRFVIDDNSLTPICSITCVCDVGLR